MNLDGTTWELMKAFRDDRLAKIESREIPVSLAEGPSTAIHLLPASAFEPGSSVDLSVALSHRPLAGLTGESWGLSYDLEGLLLWESSTAEETTSYVQVFRTGAIEIVDTFLLSSGADGGRPEIRSFEHAIDAAIRNCIGVLKDVGAHGPLAASLSLSGIRGWVLDGGETGDSRLAPRPIDRDEIVAPECFLEDLASDPGRTIKAILDPLWNAAGYPGSKTFAPDGARRG